MSSNIHVIALLLGLSAGAMAQNTPQEKPPRQPPPATSQKPAQVGPSAVIPATALRGAEISLEGAAPEKGAAPAGREPAEGPKAKLEDVVFATHDGRLSHAVVSLSGKTVLVPAASLKLSVVGEKPTGSIKMTAAQLEAAPPFDMEKAKRDGVDAAMGEGKGAPKGEKPEKEKPEKGNPATPPENPKGDAAPKLAMSSQLESWGLHANDQPFGRVKEAAVDTGRGAVAYLLATPAGGGDMIVVPFAACSCARAEKDVILKVSKTSEQLGSAPKYEKPPQGFLSSDQMQRAEEFFGTRGPVGS